MRLRELIPKSARRFARELGAQAIPKRWRLPMRFQWDKLRGGLEEEMLILNRLTVSRTMAVDIGANRGYYSYLMSKLFDRVEAFEANPEIVKVLRHYAAPNIRINTVALSSEAGSAILYIPVVNGVRYPGWASFDRSNLPACKSFETLEVQTVALDSVNLRDVSLIKIDVEGHEMKVLAGAHETICKYRPVIIGEIKKNNRESADAFFTELDYKCFLTEGASIQEVAEGLRNYSGSKETFILKPAF